MRKNEGEKESKRGVERVDNVWRRKKEKEIKHMVESEMEKGKII